jgi:hypothetical protein
MKELLNVFFFFFFFINYHEIIISPASKNLMGAAIGAAFVVALIVGL